jgi:ABC-type branched-subunit amino acid transport system permease subunit
MSRADLRLPLLSLTISQVAPILPYLFLVLILIFRPKGLLGNAGGLTPWQPQQDATTASSRSTSAAGDLVLFALALAVAPLLFTSSLALTMLSQIGYLIIICLSYNMLLGQGGMLSFGHAVYVGPGLLHRHPRDEPGQQGRLPVPLVLIPIVGGWAACSSPRCSASSPPRSPAPPSP